MDDAGGPTEYVYGSYAALQAEPRFNRAEFNDYVSDRLHETPDSYLPHSRRAPPQDFDVGRAEQSASRVTRDRSFEGRCLALFRDRKNVEYMYATLVKHRIIALNPKLVPSVAKEVAMDELAVHMHEFDARSVLDSDTLALRGAAINGVRIWNEVKRLNRAYFHSRRETKAATARYEHVASLDPAARREANKYWDESEESYTMRAFEADSLRPPGLEHLNDNVIERATAGELFYGDGTNDSGRNPLADYADSNQVFLTARENNMPITARPTFGRIASRRLNSTRSVHDAKEMFGASIEGNLDMADNDVDEDVAQAFGAARSHNKVGVALKALIELDGGETDLAALKKPPSATEKKAAAAKKKALEDRSTATRFMRYEQIPIQQTAGRHDVNLYERSGVDIDSTLSTAGRVGSNELGSHVRRFEGMEKLRHPNGTHYRR